MSMAPPGKSIVLTGGTGAIGGAAAASLVALGYRVLLVVRDPNRAATRLSPALQRSEPGRIETVTGDLSSMASVRSAGSTILADHPKLDGLIHCAAVFTKDRQATSEGFELMFATNHLGPYLLTQTLLPALKAGAPSRVVTVSAPSTTELDFDDLQSSRKFSAFRAFGATKTENLLFAYELARRLEGTGVTSNVLFPGVVKSKLMQEAPAVARGLAGLMGKGPEEAGSALAWLASDPSLVRTTGTFYKLTKPGDSSAYSRDAQNQGRLWEASERLISQATDTI